jgi:hypothetical protein
MKPKIFTPAKLPERYLNDGRYFDREELNWDSCEKSFAAAEVDEVRYYYLGGSYEGDGHALIHSKSDGGLWYHLQLSHCSCYGPTEDAELGVHHWGRGYATIEELLADCSDEMKEYLAPLVPRKRN